MDFIIRDLLGAGQFGILAAEPQAGKTWLLLHAAICLALGQPFLGEFSVPKRGPVVFISQDDQDSDLRDKLSQLLCGIGIAGIPDFYIIPNCGFNVASKEFEDLLVKFRAIRPIAVFIDTYRLIHTFEENDATAMTYVNTLLQQISTHSGAAVMCAHHLRKPSREAMGGAIHRIRGSSAEVADAKVVWSIASEVSAYPPPVLERKTRFDIPKFKGGFNMPGFWYKLILNAENHSAIITYDEKAGKERETVEMEILLLLGNGQRHKIHEVMARAQSACKVSDRWVRGVLKGLIDSQKIVQFGKGKKIEYALPGMASFDDQGRIDLA